MIDTYMGGGKKSEQELFILSLSRAQLIVWFLKHILQVN